MPPKGEPLAGRATSYWTPEARQGAKGRALLQRPADAVLSSGALEFIKTKSFFSVDRCLTGTPEAPPLGELSKLISFD